MGPAWVGIVIDVVGVADVDIDGSVEVVVGGENVGVGLVVGVVQ